MRPFPLNLTTSMIERSIPLFQERWRRRPFWMLVACVLVNRTRWEQARSVHAEIMRRWPYPHSLRDASPVQVRDVVAPLGLAEQRTVNLMALAKVWSRFGGGWHRRHLKREDILKLPGCGKYAADSWAIFILGESDLPGVTDRRLLAYQARVPGTPAYHAEVNRRLSL